MTGNPEADTALAAELRHAEAEVARLARLVDLLNAYGRAMVGDQWWPGNASVWLSGPEGAELEELVS